MPNPITAIAQAVSTVATWWSTAGAFVQTAIKVVAFVAIDSAVTKKPKFGAQSSNKDLSRDITVRSAVEPRKIIYGETLASGPLVYQNTSGSDNEYLWEVIAIAGHECSDFLGVWVDDIEIDSSDINWGSAVTGSTKFATYSTFWKQLGTSTQTVLSALNSAFASDFTTAHRGRGIAYLTARFLLNNTSNDTAFKSGPPRNIRALVRGKKVYDPRKDPSSSRYGGSGAHDVTDSSTWEWSDNPVLCTADYLIDSDLGPGFPYTRIDYDVVADEATYCEGQVPIPTASYSNRFTCNGVLYTTDTHKVNIQKLLSSMNGRLGYSGGKFQIRAGRIGEGPNVVEGTSFSIGVTASNVLEAANYDPVDSTEDWGSIASAATVTEDWGSIASSATDFEDWGLLELEFVYYHVSYEIKNYVSGGVLPLLGLTDGTEVTSDGFYNELIENSGYDFSFIDGPSGNFSGTIDNVEVHKVTAIHIDEHWLIGDISIKTANAKSDRFNTFTAIIKDPDRYYKDSESLRVTQAAYVTRDGGETLKKEVSLPMTDSDLMAQRLMFKQLYATDQEKVIVIPCNYKALQCTIHDFVVVSIAELNWVEKLFRVVDWNFKDISEGGIDLVLKEDAASAYAEPDEDDYSTRDASGVITFGDPGVLAPSNLTATSQLTGNLVEWDLPAIYNRFDTVILYASEDSAWANASEIYRGRANAFLHKLDEGETRYYWIRAITTSEVSLRNPNSDTSSVTATAGRVETNIVRSTFGLLNHSFEAGDYGWDLDAIVGVGQDMIIVNDPTNARMGDWCAYLQANGDLNTSAEMLNIQKIQCIEGDVFRVKCFVKATKANIEGAIIIRWYNSSDAIISTSTDSYVAPGTSYVVQYFTAMAPANTLYCRIGYRVEPLVGVDSDARFYVDGFSVLDVTDLI